MSSASIRPATADDVDAIHQLLGHLAAFLSQEEIFTATKESLLTYGFEQSDFFHTLVAVDQGAPEAVVIFFKEFSTWRGVPGVYIQDLYVSEKLRGRGVGRELVSAAIEFGTTHWQSGYVRLAVDRLNQQAIDFYLRIGFSIDKDNHIMYSPVV